MMTNRVVSSDRLPRDTTRAAGAAMPFADRLTCTVAEACAATGLGRTKLYELMGAGLITSSTIGRRRLIQVPSLLKLLVPR
jgi:excisionase family DNA binding protein